MSTRNEADVRRCFVAENVERVENDLTCFRTKRRKRDGARAGGTIHPPKRVVQPHAHQINADIERKYARKYHSYLSTYRDGEREVSR